MSQPYCNWNFRGNPMVCLDLYDGFTCVPHWLGTTQKSPHVTAPPSFSSRAPSADYDAVTCTNGETTRRA